MAHPSLSLVQGITQTSMVHKATIPRAGQPHVLQKHHTSEEAWPAWDPGGREWVAGLQPFLEASVLPA